MANLDRDNRWARGFQTTARDILRSHYSEVIMEWRSSAGATDLLSADRDRYAPRVDLAVGPFNVTPGRGGIRRDQIVEAMRPWFVDLVPNPNPRCLLAVEVIYNGSAKHLLGDLLNASAMGLFGLVVCRPGILRKVERNRQYLSAIAELGKIPSLFQNTRVIDTAEFSRALLGSELAIDATAPD